MDGNLILKMDNRIILLVLINILAVITMSKETKANDHEQEQKRLKEMIERNGCPFINKGQKVDKKVCLMPGYDSSELPNGDNTTKVYINIRHVTVLKVHEKDTTVKMDLMQVLYWEDNRIRIKFDDDDKTNASHKISREKYHHIWNPEEDIHTSHLQEWKSRYDPHPFKKIVILPENPFYFNRTLLRAEKHWSARILCKKFDLSSFPLDTQSCAFLQSGEPDNLKLLLYDSDNRGYSDRKWQSIGFDITITFVGNNTAIPQTSTGSNNDDADPVIGFTVTLKRIVEPYLYQYYFPCMAIVVVSQISFIIPLSSIPGRVALTVTQFLTLTNLFIHQMVRFIFEMYPNIYD